MGADFEEREDTAVDGVGVEGVEQAIGKGDIAFPHGVIGMVEAVRVQGGMAWVLQQEGHFFMQHLLKGQWERGVAAAEAPGRRDLFAKGGGRSLYVVCAWLARRGFGSASLGGMFSWLVFRHGVLVLSFCYVGRVCRSALVVVGYVRMHAYERGGGSGWTSGVLLPGFLSLHTPCGKPLRVAVCPKEQRVLHVVSPLDRGEQGCLPGVLGQIVEFVREQDVRRHVRQDEFWQGQCLRCEDEADRALCPFRQHERPPFSLDELLPGVRTDQQEGEVSSPSGYSLSKQVRKCWHGTAMWRVLEEHDRL